MMGIEEGTAGMNSGCCMEANLTINYTKKPTKAAGKNNKWVCILPEFGGYRGVRMEWWSSNIFITYPCQGKNVQRAHPVYLFLFKIITIKSCQFICEILEKLNSLPFKPKINTGIP